MKGQLDRKRPFDARQSLSAVMLVGAAEGGVYLRADAFQKRIHGSKGALHGSESLEEALALTFQPLGHGIDPCLRKLVLIRKVFDLAVDGAAVIVEQLTGSRMELGTDTDGDIKLNTAGRGISRIEDLQPFGTSGVHSETLAIDAHTAVVAAVSRTVDVRRDDFAGRIGDIQRIAALFETGVVAEANEEHITGRTRQTEGEEILDSIRLVEESLVELGFINDKCVGKKRASDASRSLNGDSDLG